MIRYIPLYIAIALTILLGGTISSHLQKTWVQQELRQFPERGLSYKFLAPDLIEIHNDFTGESRAVFLDGPSLEEVHTWANSNGVPILVVDPSQIDTNLYATMFSYWITVPMANFSARPVLLGDADNNGKPEVYGVQRIPGPGCNYFTRVYEIEANGSIGFRYDFGCFSGTPRHLLDIDKNGLVELLMDTLRASKVYTQSHSDSLPVVYRFTHRRFEINSIVTGQILGYLDQDESIDFAYIGDQFDSSAGNASIRQYVAEYDAQADSFVRRWNTDFGGRGRLGIDGHGVGDFDGDGRAEFTVSSGPGNLWVIENIANDAYAVVWEDSLPLINMYWNTAGDVDGDGKIEFFVGGQNFSTGSWTVVFEADSNNHYSPTFMIRFLGGSLFPPTYTAGDIDGDGTPELVMMIGGAIMIFKSDGDNSYYLWYYRQVSYAGMLSLYDFNANGKLDIAVTRIGDLNPQHQTQVWLFAGPAGLEEPRPEIPGESVLHQNYPNPFNASTVIRFSLSANTFVTVTVYDVLGKEVKTLVHGEMGAGQHLVEWNPEGMASGVYFYRLVTKEVMLTRKMLFLQ